MKLFYTEKELEKEVDRRFYARESERLMTERIERMEIRMNNMQHHIDNLAERLNRHLETNEGS